MGTTRPLERYCRSATSRMQPLEVGNRISTLDCRVLNAIIDIVAEDEHVDAAKAFEQYEHPQYGIRLKRCVQTNMLPSGGGE